MKKNLFCALLTMSVATGFTQNVGIGTATPGTKLDVNGAITNRETSIAVTSNAVSIAANISQVQLTGSATDTIVVTAAAAPNAGQRLIIYNNTSGGFVSILNGYIVPYGQAVEFAYSNGGYRATNGNIDPSNFWKLTGNSGTIPSTSAIGTTANKNFIGTTDNVDWVAATNKLEHLRVKANGFVGINSSSPIATLVIQAVDSMPTHAGTLNMPIIASFLPIGGQNVNSLGAISVNNRALLGYRPNDNLGRGKYAYLTGNTGTSIRLMASDNQNNYDDSALVISGAVGSLGFVGIGTATPSSILSISNDGNVSNNSNHEADNINLNSYGSLTDPALFFYSSTGSQYSQGNIVNGTQLMGVAAKAMVNNSVQTLSGIYSNFTGNSTITGSNLQFSTSQSNATNNVRMTIDSSGFVGIGTATPHADLHVNGALALGITTPSTAATNGTKNTVNFLNSGTFTPPTASSLNSGVIYIIRNVSTVGTPVTVANVIDFGSGTASSFTLTSTIGAITIMSVGNNWYRIQ